MLIMLVADALALMFLLNLSLKTYLIFIFFVPSFASTFLTYIALPCPFLDQPHTGTCLFILLTA